MILALIWSAVPTHSSGWGSCKSPGRNLVSVAKTADWKLATDNSPIRRALTSVAAAGPCVLRRSLCAPEQIIRRPCWDYEDS